MHALGPAENVMLPSTPRLIPSQTRKYQITHVDEYIPGVFASSADGGSWLSHRSGLNSSASDPHVSLA